MLKYKSQLFGAHGQGLRVIGPEEGGFMLTLTTIRLLQSVLWKIACGVLASTSDFRHPGFQTSR